MRRCHLQDGDNGGRTGRNVNYADAACDIHHILDYFNIDDAVLLLY